jgi:hypothetical protein
MGSERDSVQRRVSYLCLCKHLEHTTTPSTSSTRQMQSQRTRMWLSLRTNTSVLPMQVQRHSAVCPAIRDAPEKALVSFAPTRRRPTPPGQLHPLPPPLCFCALVQTLLTGVRVCAAHLLARPTAHTHTHTQACVFYGVRQEEDFRCCIPRHVFSGHSREPPGGSECSPQATHGIYRSAAIFVTQITELVCMMRPAPLSAARIQACGWLKWLLPFAHAATDRPRMQARVSPQDSLTHPEATNA